MLARTLAATAAMLALGVAQAHAGKLPHITGVAFTKAPDGTFTATLAGINFGTPPGDIPCTACSPVELQTVDLSSQPFQLAVNVDAWSDTSVTISEIPATKGDAMRIALYNATIGNVAAWGGRVSPDKQPHAMIKSIVTSGTGQNLVITINGTGFGPAIPQVGQSTDSPFLVISDFNANAPYTDGFPWNAGFCGQNDCNGVAVNYTSWSDTQVVISGFGSEYGGSNGDWQANPRDALCVGIWPSTSTTNGTTGGTTRCIRLPKA